jgi:hypothetical protein
MKINPHKNQPKPKDKTYAKYFKLIGMPLQLSPVGNITKN